MQWLQVQWNSVFDYLNKTQLAGASLGHWVSFLALTFLFDLIIRLVVWTVLRRFKKHAEQSETEYDDYVVHLLDRTRWYGFLGFSSLLSLTVVNLEVRHALFRGASMVLIYLQVGTWGNSLIDTLLAKAFKSAKMSEASVKTASGVVRWFTQVLLWAIVVLLILSACNIEITPLIAGLGVGGLAITFALQKILGDIFCSVAIVIDRPFEVGDFIIVGDYMGGVEHIGIKTTRVRSLSGEQIIFANSDLLGSRVRNYKRMKERRVVFGFGVLYSTTVDKVEQIPEIVKEIINAVEKARLDRAHFKAFGDSALQFEVVYYVLSPDYNLFMDLQQQINLELLRRFESQDIEMAFPSRTLYLDSSATDVIWGSGTAAK